LGDGTGVRKLKILMSAYSCAPRRGSEPGAGWGFVREMAEHHEVWAITRLSNRSFVEEELERDPAPSLHMVYYDLPLWTMRFKRGSAGTLAYYYLWQWGAYRLARTLAEQVTFDVTHHVTFGSFWMPSFTPLLGRPFVWGPVGGGEQTPMALKRDLHLRSRIYETIRHWTQCAGQFNPLVRLAARRSSVALVTTQDTARRVRSMGAENVKEFYQVGLTRQEIHYLSTLHTNPSGVFRFVSVGRLLGWKGFELALRAFPQSGLTDAQYWIIGSGPERKRLEKLAQKLGVARRVQFWGSLPRDSALRQMAACDVLLHPSHHDSGGTVCVEAMAARKPVICINTGGPGVQVTKETGFPIDPGDSGKLIGEIAAAMKTLANDPKLREQLGNAGRQRVIDRFTFDVKCNELCEIYEQVLKARLPEMTSSPSSSSQPETRQSMEPLAPS